MLNLNDVTLVGIIGSKYCAKNTVRAILYSKREINFYKTQILSCVPLQIPGIDVIVIPAMTKVQFFQFMIKKLNDYIFSSHMLLVQDDGFVINKNAWVDDFLEYDYIGALWKQKTQGIHERTTPYRCGNGGFSLRSKKLLEVLQKFFPGVPGLEDDQQICRVYRPFLERFGIKFATDEIAALFSVEDDGDKIPELSGQSHKDRFTLKTFGFHNPKSDALKFLDHVSFNLDKV